jgi:hypothetical protein
MEPLLQVPLEGSYSRREELNGKEIVFDVNT